MRLFHLILATLLTGSISNNCKPGMAGFIWNHHTRVVLRVYKNSPAEESGLQKYDKIVEVDGDPRGEIDQFAGDTIPITVTRKGETLHLTILLRTREEIHEKSG
jgi:S1-C subfamily serine protease